MKLDEITNDYRKAADAGITDPNFQAVYALEYIAVMMGRMDKRLASIAEAIKGGNVGTGKALHDLTGSIKDLAGNLIRRP